LLEVSLKGSFQPITCQVLATKPEQLMERTHNNTSITQNMIKVARVITENKCSKET